MKTNHPYILVTLLVVALLPAQGFAKKPPKPPKPITAGDVVCDGCVGTADIENGAITTEKLSSDIQNELANSSSAPILYDADGIVIGRFLSYIYEHREAGSMPELMISGVSFVTRQGYTTHLKSVGNYPNTAGELVSKKLLFTNYTCSGQPTHVVASDYLLFGSTIDFTTGNFSVNRGGAFINDYTGTPTIYYIPKDAEKVFVQEASQLLSDGTCYPDASLHGYEAILNDPDVTGITLSTYKLPLRIE